MNNFKNILIHVFVDAAVGLRMKLSFVSKGIILNISTQAWLAPARRPPRKIYTFYTPRATILFKFYDSLMHYMFPRFFGVYPRFCFGRFVINCIFSDTKLVFLISYWNGEFLLCEPMEFWLCWFKMDVTFKVGRLFALNHEKGVRQKRENHQRNIICSFILK